MFRLFMATIMSAYFYNSVTVMAQPCTEESHCAIGFFCDTTVHSCCFNCYEIKRHLPTSGSTCVSLGADCGSCLDGFIEDPTKFPQCVPPTVEPDTKTNWLIYAGASVVIGGIIFALYYCFRKKIIPCGSLRISTQSAKFPPLNDSPQPTPSAPPPPSSLPSQPPLSAPFQWGSGPPLQAPPKLPIQPPAYNDVLYSDSRGVPMSSRERSTNQNARCFNRPYYDNDPQNIPSTPQEEEESALLNSNQGQNGNEYVDNLVNDSSTAAAEPEPLPPPLDDRTLHPAGDPALHLQVCNDNNNNNGNNSSSNYTSNNNNSNNNNRYNTSTNNSAGGSTGSGPTMMQAQFLVIKMPDINIDVNTNQPHRNPCSDVSN